MIEYLQWPGMDDRTLVQKMLKDLQSEEWHECREFVKKRIQLQANNISQDCWDDLTQDVMIKILRSLPKFEYKCMFKTWIVGIVRSSIIDDYRKSMRAEQLATLPSDSYDDSEQDDSEQDDNASPINVTLTVEEQCIVHDALGEARTLLQDYVSARTNQERNRRILDMVIYEARSLEETAKVVGCSAPVAGYIVRSAQRYVREKFREKGYQEDGYDPTEYSFRK